MCALLDDSVLQAVVSESERGNIEAMLLKAFIFVVVVPIDLRVRVLLQRFGDVRAAMCGRQQQAGMGAGDEKGGLGGFKEKLDLDAIEEDVRDIRKQLDLCAVAAAQDGGLEIDSGGKQPNGSKYAALL